MPTQPPKRDRIQLVRECVLKGDALRHIQATCPDMRENQAHFFPDKLTCVIRDIELFYRLVTEKGHGLTIYSEVIEAIMEVPARRGITPWKVMLHSDYYTTFVTKYGSEAEHSHKRYNFYSGRRKH